VRRTAFVKALESIHEGGFLHGSIARDNLIIRSNIKQDEVSQVGVVIVGLGHAVSNPSNDDMVAEHKMLMKLLPNPSKRAESGDHTRSFVHVFPEAALVLEPSDCSSSSMTCSPKKIRHTRLANEGNCGRADPAKKNFLVH
jgi:hypothetical protein